MDTGFENVQMMLLCQFCRFSFLMSYSHSRCHVRVIYDMAVRFDREIRRHMTNDRPVIYPSGKTPQASPHNT